MKTKILFSAAVVVAGSIIAAQAGPSDDVSSAVQKLAGEDNYSWNTTTVVPADARFKPGPQEGKTEKGGVTYTKITFGDNETEIYMKGTNAAVSNPDGGWQSLSDLEGDDQGPGRFMAGMIRNFRTPAMQAGDLAAGVTDLVQTNGAYAGTLTPDAAKKMLSFRRGGNNVSNASGTVMFWVANGELTKFENHLKGTVSFQGNDVDVDRDTTVAISNVGSTKIIVPDDAKKVMQ